MPKYKIILDLFSDASYISPNLDSSGNCSCLTRARTLFLRARVLAALAAYTCCRNLRLCNCRCSRPSVGHCKCPFLNVFFVYRVSLTPISKKGLSDRAEHLLLYRISPVLIDDLSTTHIRQVFVSKDLRCNANRNVHLCVLNLSNILSVQIFVVFLQY